MTTLAGGIAERFWTRRRPGRPDDWSQRIINGADMDSTKAVDLALYMSGSAEEASAYLRWLEVGAKQIVANGSKAIEDVARALLNHRTLSGKKIEAIIWESRGCVLRPEGPVKISRTR